MLLAVFVVFLGIAVFHPLSHSLQHDGDDGHDCPICLWLHYVAEGSFFAVVFYAIFSAISFIPALSRIPSVKTLPSANISRAPPLS